MSHFALIEHVPVYLDSCRCPDPSVPNISLWEVRKNERFPFAPYAESGPPFVRERLTPCWAAGVATDGTRFYARTQRSASLSLPADIPPMGSWLLQGDTLIMYDSYASAWQSHSLSLALQQYARGASPAYGASLVPAHLLLSLLLDSEWDAHASTVRVRTLAGEQVTLTMPRYGLWNAVQRGIVDAHTHWTVQHTVSFIRSVRPLLGAAKKDVEPFASLAAMQRARFSSLWNDLPPSSSPTQFTGLREMLQAPPTTALRTGYHLYFYAENSHDPLLVVGAATGLPPTWLPEDDAAPLLTRPYVYKHV